MSIERLTGLHYGAAQEILVAKKVQTVIIRYGNNFPKIKHTTTIANGTREKPFPNLSTMLHSVPFLSTKQSTRTAIPTPDSTANWYISTSMENKIRYIHHLKYDLTKIEKIPKKVKSFASYPSET